MTSSCFTRFGYELITLCEMDSRSVAKNILRHSTRLQLGTIKTFQTAYIFISITEKNIAKSYIWDID